MELIALAEDGLEYAGKQVGGVHAGDLDAATPCTEWSVRQLLNHLIGSVDVLTRLAAGEPVDRREVDAHLLANTDWIGDDPMGAFARVADRSLAVWRMPGAFDRPIDFPAPGTPASVVANLQIVETLVHGWDVGTATGAAPEMPASTAASGLSWVRGFLGQAGRGPFFGPAVPLADGGSHTDELVAFVGRNPVTPAGRSVR